MESDHLCTCNSQRTAGIDADRTLDGVSTGTVVVDLVPVPVAAAVPYGTGTGTAVRYSRSATAVHTLE
jgi:hypothetical protein